MNYDVSFPYEDVYNRYIVQNCSGEELMAHYNISKSTFFKILRYYGIKKDTKLANENRVKTVIAKYGVENISQCETVKVAKQTTSLEHFGVKNPMQSIVIKNKATLTNLEKYGAETPAGNPAVLAKMQNTCLQKYGVKNPSLVSEFKEKRKQTNRERFGVDCNLALEKYQDMIKETVLQKYGVPYFCMSRTCHGTSRGSRSKANDLVSQKLTENNIEFEREYILNGYIYDFKINNILVEINPTYTHSVDIAYHNKSRKISKKYHNLKSKNALDRGFLCVQVFDWDNIDEIVDNIKSNKYRTMVARKIIERAVNLKTKEIRQVHNKQEEQAYLSNGFVRVYDDGYDLIKE